MLYNGARDIYCQQMRYRSVHSLDKILVFIVNPAVRTVTTGLQKVEMWSGLSPNCEIRLGGKKQCRISVRLHQHVIGHTLVLMQEICKVTDWPRRRAVAEFRLFVGHDCSGAHLHRIAIRPDPYCTLRNHHELIDRNHVGQCTALSNETECERYWEARTKMMGNWLRYFIINIFLWLPLSILLLLLTPQPWVDLGLFNNSIPLLSILDRRPPTNNFHPL